MSDFFDRHTDAMPKNKVVILVVLIALSGKFFGSKSNG